MISNRGITFKLVFFILSSCTIIFALIFGYNYLLSRRIIIREIEENAENLTLLTVSKIEAVLRPMEKVPKSLATSLEQSAYEKEELINLLHSAIKNNPEIYGGTIAFEPYAFDKGSLYFSPYFYRNDGKIKFINLGNDSYRYFYWDWYQIPKELEHPVWSEPYYDEGGGNIIMSTYSVPFYRNVEGKRKFTGVVTADVSLSWLQDIVSSIKIAETGYGFLISNNGTIVTHPHQDLVMHETIFSVAEARGDARLRQIGKDMIRGGSGFIPFESIVTGKKCWMVYAPLPSTGWSLSVLFPQDELMADVTKLNRTVLALGISGFLFLLTVIVLIAGTITKPLRALVRTTKDIATGNLNFNLPPIKSQDEVGKLASSFIYMKGALKKYIAQLKDTTAVKERMESELKIAHDIQMGIVPKTFPPFPERPEFDIYAVLVPAKEVGGDLYDFFFIDRDHLCLVIGDVSDKGVPAALFMAVVKTLIKTIAGELKSPDKILQKVNKEVALENDSCMFVTVFCAILNTVTGEIDYANAGHNAPLVIRRERQVEFLKKTGNPAVGAREDVIYKREKLILQAGDTICMYTDGVTEAFNKQEELFSEEKLKKEVSIHQQDSAEQLVKAMLKKVKDFSQGVPQSDDITIVALKYLRSSKAVFEITEKKTLVLKNDISELRKLAETIADFGRKNNFSRKVIGDINLALEELISNTISYGYSDAKEHRITINFDLRQAELTLEIIDDARAFNPLEIPEPNIDQPLEERKVGGLGIYLVRKLMDKLEYSRQEEKNILIIKKKIKEKAGNDISGTVV